MCWTGHMRHGDTPVQFTLYPCAYGSMRAGLTFSVSELTQSGISVSDPCCNEDEMNESGAYWRLLFGSLSSKHGDREPITTQQGKSRIRAVFSPLRRPLISRLYPLENLWPSLWGAVMIAFERLGYSLTTFFSHGGETGPHYLCSTVESLESSTA